MYITQVFQKLMWPLTVGHYEVISSQYQTSMYWLHPLLKFVYNAEELFSHIMRF